MRLGDARNIINHGGGDNRLLAIIFDNIAKRWFKTGEFVFDQVFLTLGDDTEVVRMEEEDTKGNKYFVYKHVENIQAILMVPEPEDNERIEKRFIMS